MGIEQKLRESLHRSAASLGEPTLRWDDVGAHPVARTRSSARASFAAVLAFAIAIGSFVFLKDAFKSHPIPPAHRASPVESRSLAARLGLSRYAVVPAGCNEWVEVVDGGSGYCLDGVVPGGAEMFLIAKVLQGSIPSQPEINQVSRDYGATPPAAAEIALANVQVRSVADGVAHVGYEVQWPDGVFPGIFRCTWTVFDGHGNQLGTKTEGVAAMAPRGGLERVPTSGTPTRAEASCGKRLDSGPPYSFDFTHVSGYSAESQSFDATWAGTGTPGPVSCTALFFDASGDFTDLHRFNFLALTGEAQNGAHFPSTSPPPEPPGSARIACSPLTKPMMSTKGTYLGGARPAADAKVGSGQGCVPYSPARREVLVCSDVGTIAPPEPTPYFNRDICQAAALSVNDPNAMTDAMAVHFPIPADGKGPVEVSTCAIVQNTFRSLDVVFVRNKGKNNVHVEYVLQPPPG